MVNTANYGMNAWKEGGERSENSSEEESDSEEETVVEQINAAIELKYKTEYLYDERVNYSAVRGVERSKFC